MSRALPRRALLLSLALAPVVPVVQAAPPAPLPRFAVEVSDGVFSPRRLEIPARQRVRIDLVNHGPGPLEFENDEMHIEKVLSAGASSFIVLPPLEPGRYEFVDEFNPITGVLLIDAA